MGTTRREFTLEFKTEAANRIIGTGRTVVEVAGEHSLDKGSVARWPATSAGGSKRWRGLG